jgi:thaumarchaeosortase
MPSRVLQLAKTQAIKNKAWIANRILSKLCSFTEFVKAKAIIFLPIFSFVIPILLLYWMYPNTFEAVWTGTFENRMYYLFFLWILALETILSWEELKTLKFDLRSPRTIVFFIMLSLPTVYVIAANYLGFNTLLATLAKGYTIGQAWANLVPLSTEYIVLAVFLILIMASGTGLQGLKQYPTSTFFLVLIGIVYSINNFYPFGQFTPFQILVTPTATCASIFLRLLGYTTSLDQHGRMPALFATLPPHKTFGAFIDWPCSGVESLLIYTVVIFLFLRKSAIPFRSKVIYFVFGAIITFFINVLRIVTIFVIAVNGGDWGIFHDYYGSLYSITWIICYPLIILGTQVLLERIRKSRLVTPKKPDLTSQISIDGVHLLDKRGLMNSISSLPYQNLRENDERSPLSSL